MTRERGAVPGITAPLAHTPFRVLVTGRVLMLFGNGMAHVALAFAVLDVTGSLAQVGLVVGARSIANVALLLLGGVLADRFPRALVIRGACLLAAVSQALLAVFLLSGTATLWLMVALSVLNGAAAAANLPAIAALTPQTVPGSLLRQANALAGIAKQLGMFAGMSVGGVLVGLVGPGWAIGADAALFAAAGLVFLFLRVPSTAVPSRGVLRDLLDGWSEFVARPWVWIVVLQFMVVNAGWSSVTAVLGPGIADDTFGRTTWGLLMAANSVGLLVGGVLAARWQPRRALFYGTALVTLQTLPFFVMAGPSPLVPLLFAAMFAGGVAMQQFSVAWEVSVQENVPPERLSRVYSYDALGSFVAMPVGQIAIGPVAEAIGPDRALLIVAGLTLTATFAAVATPSVRSLRRR
ncbi:MULTISPECIES: MFS transporter [Nocardiopsis]|uniref:MFS transporter n=1 Tax=Nocardiopsis TaxID=2013 RepID=UPI000370B824|nr:MULTISPECIES: MFS transporter [Nocardiopsis]PWV50125.1 putative MFS family arabinose efflux permease [Nocardiopsis sp. L17-MgMaSL7]